MNKFGNFKTKKSKGFQNSFSKTFFKPFTKMVFRELDLIIRLFYNFEKPCSNLTTIGFIKGFQKGLKNVFFLTVSKWFF